jgi:hypothetical protein
LAWTISRNSFVLATINSTLRGKDIKHPTQKYIFWFWLPLFASWLLMTAEGPFVTAAINRLPDEVIMLAAQGIVVSLSVTIESPIINLLATSTALVRDRHSFLLMRRFTLHWAIGLTVIATALAFTPLFDVVILDWMGTPTNVARWVRPGLQIMTLWSAAIAWRRFLQGVLIRFGQTHYVAWGTAVRLVASGGTAAALALWSGWPGVVTGATALMAGVTAEAAFATIAVRPLLRTKLAPGTEEVEGAARSYGELLSFHLPLAGTALLTLLAQPLVTFSLARLDNPTLTLAAWPLVFQLVLISRAAALALPEAVIALTSGPESYRPVRRFSFGLAGASLLAMTVLVLTPLLPFYLERIQDTELPVAVLAASGTRLFLLYPALFVLLSWLRGLLISHRATKAVNLGMAINLAATAVILIVAVALRLPGIVAAAAALNVALVAELFVIVWRTRVRLPAALSFSAGADPQLAAASSQGDAG